MYNKKSSSELKSLSKGLLIGHYALPMGAFVITTLISVMITLILEFMFSLNSYSGMLFYVISLLIVSLLITVLSVGNQVIALKISRQIPAGLGDLFYGFSHQPDRMILLSLLLLLILFGCMAPGILLLVSGIMSSFFYLELLGILVLLAGFVACIYLFLTYSQVAYIYIEDPEKSVMEIMRESKSLMHGSKGRYFYLSVSFLGLTFLSFLSCYIGLLWLSPYIETTHAMFYRNLKGEV